MIDGSMVRSMAGRAAGFAQVLIVLRCDSGMMFELSDTETNEITYRREGRSILYRTPTLSM